MCLKDPKNGSKIDTKIIPKRTKRQQQKTLRKRSPKGADLQTGGACEPTRCFATPSGHTPSSPLKGNPLEPQLSLAQG
jgi:hypothetical protein